MFENLNEMLEDYENLKRIYDNGHVVVVENYDTTPTFHIGRSVADFTNLAVMREVNVSDIQNNGGWIAVVREFPSTN